MSKTIEERVVSMKFDNKDFEKNASTSLSTLDKLKQALSFKGASKGLSEVNNSVKGVDFSPILAAADKINGNFSMMGRICTGALEDIGRQAIQTGEQMLKSLTIDPVREGFEEYELKLGSIQTILNSARDADGNSVGLDVVKAKLEELNTYADKTIYSFSDMTDSIGKFTNAGVDLDKAVAAIQGISNEAALSGANANQASHAMYNFAQALSSGTVKLIDWKSIENANMATVEFKEELLKTAEAMNTVAKNADGTYTVLTSNNQGKLFDDVVSASHAFNDSLQYQWLTADVLIDTLGRYANEEDELGQKAFKAAQEVKSFTQLMDTLKEAVGSGWAETWELVFGDFYEAKDLWTRVNDVVGTYITNMSNARNETLKGWKAMDGRAAVLDGLKAAFQGIKNVIIPITEAFHEFFPPATAENLANISFKFRNLMFAFSEGTAQMTGLKGVFRGLFAVLKIVYNAFHTLFVVVSPLFSLIFKSGNGLLTVLGDIGNKIADMQGIVSSIIDTALLHTIEVLPVVAGAAAYGILKLIEVIKDLVASFDIPEQVTKFTGFIKDEFNDLSEKIKASGVKEGLLDFANVVQYEIIKLGENIKTDGVKQAFVTFFDHIKMEILGFGPKIVEAFGKVKESITNSIKNMGESFKEFDGIDTGSMDDFVSKTETKLSPLTVIFGGLGMAFLKIKDVIAKVSPYITKYFPVVADVVVSFIKRIGHYLANMNASELMDWINTGALVSFVMSFKNLTGALGGVGEMFEAASGAFKELGGVLKDYQKNLKADILLKIAGAIAILAGSLIALSFVPKEKLWQSVGAMAAVFGLLVTALKLILGSLGGNGEGGLKKQIVGVVGQMGLINSLGKFMLEFAGAIAIMTGAILALSNLGGDQLKIALLGIGGIEALLGAIAILVAKLPKSENSLFALGASLLMMSMSVQKLAEAVIILIPPLETLGKMDRETLIQGGIALAGMLAALGLAMAASSKAGLGSGVAFLAITVAVKEMVDAISVLGEMDVKKLIKGTAALSASILAISLLAHSAGSSGFGMGSGVGLLAMAASLEIIIDVISKFADMKWGEWAKGVIMMAGALTVLSVAMIAMNGAQIGAVSLLMIVAALKLLVPVLNALSDIEHPIKSLLMLAGVLGVLAAATAVLTILAPGMILLGAALAAVGAGMFLFVTSLTAMAALNVPALIAVIPLLGVALMEFCKMVEMVGPTVKQTVIDIVNGIIDIVKKTGPNLIEALFVLLGSVVENLCQLIIDKAPIIVETIFVLIETLLGKLAEHLPTIAESLIQILLALLEAVKNHIGEIMTDLVTIVAQFIIGVLQGVIDNIGTIIQKVFELVTAIIEGLAAALGSEENAERLRNAIINLGKSILEFFKNFFGIHSPSTVFQELGGYLIDGLINGIGGMIDAVVDKIRELCEKVVAKIGEFLQNFFNKGKEIIENIKGGVDNVKDSLKEKFNGIIDGLKNIDVSGFIESGKNILRGFKQGIEDTQLFQDVKNATENVFGAVRDRIAGIFDEHSPSKVTFGFGKYVVIGFANGIRAVAGEAINAADEFGEGTFDSMRNAVSSITNLIENGMDSDPTIRPVLDLSNVSAGVNDLNSMINSDRSIALAASASYGANSVFSRNQNGIVVNNRDVVRSISDLRSDMHEMANAIRELQIVMDTGTLVGSIVEPMDQAFGRLRVRNERGI